jgi:uncharacterized protein with von Willebrand factor type A (vWA) domain
MFLGMKRTMTTAEAGRLGGLRSRRQLSPEAARAMVRVREARKLYRAYYATCFWWARPDLVIGAADIAWVADGLRKHGGRDAWRAAARLEKPVGAAAKNASHQSRERQCL